MRARALLCIAAALLAAALCASVADAAARGKGHATAYRGKTAQGKPIEIRGGAGSLTLARFQVRMLCHDGSLAFAGVSGFEPTPLRRGRFADAQHGKTDLVRWEGRLAAGKVAGRLEVEDRLPSGVRCASGPVRFTAKAGGR